MLAACVKSPTDVKTPIFSIAFGYKIHKIRNDTEKSTQKKSQMTQMHLNVTQNTHKTSSRLCDSSTATPSRGRHTHTYLQYGFKSTEDLHWSNDLTNSFLQEVTKRKRTPGAEASFEHRLQYFWPVDVCGLHVKIYRRPSFSKSSNSLFCTVDLARMSLQYLKQNSFPCTTNQIFQGSMHLSTLLSSYSHLQIKLNEEATGHYR